MRGGAVVCRSWTQPSMKPRKRRALDPRLCPGYRQAGPVVSRHAEILECVRECGLNSLSRKTKWQKTKCYGKSMSKASSPPNHHREKRKTIE